ncbi:MAG: sulfite exporter TauE/SafE family protein [Candidatus Omnitrophota bacterium]|nr:sulfite exporter TauE/SafE family protein [Candidatus Omnitrophota bacterium]
MLVILVFLVALVYASVGHGGASGYLAVMALSGNNSPTQMSTSALLLNVLVAGTAWLTFWRAGHGSFSLLWPFALTSIPAAVLGGWLPVSTQLYRRLLAACLLVAAARLCLPTLRDHERPTAPPLAVALPVGGVLGVVSGIVGVGGGIFLSPLMVLMRWADVKRTAAVSAAFIVVNSLAGLAGRLIAGRLLISWLTPLVITAFVGGVVGSQLGANHFSGLWLRRLLALVLVVAASKLALTHA